MIKKTEASRFKKVSGVLSPKLGEKIVTENDIEIPTGKEFKINSVGLNTARTLSNVAYLDQWSTPENSMITNGIM